MWKGGPGIDLLGENEFTTGMEVYILYLVGIFYSATEHQRQLLICLATTVSWIVLGILHTGLFTSHLKGEVELYLVLYMRVYLRRILRANFVSDSSLTYLFLFHDVFSGFKEYSTNVYWNTTLLLITKLRIPTYVNWQTYTMMSRLPLTINIKLQVIICIPFTCKLNYCRGIYNSDSTICM